MCCNPNSYDESNPLLGVVLCGGNSSRMGKDKGLLVKDKEPWAKVAFDKLESLGIPVVVSINSNQSVEYKKHFTEERIVIDRIGIKGPLGGILSIHDQYPNHDLMVVACDLPDLSLSLARNLVNVYEERAGEHDFIVYSIENEVEPLLGIYTSEGLKKIFSLYLSNQLEKLSMKYVLEVGNTFSVELEQDRRRELKNYNFKEDLE